MKFSGRIGYSEDYEEPAGSGIWRNKIVEVPCRGTLTTTNKRWENGPSANDDLKLNETLSFVVRPQLRSKLSKIAYVKKGGEYWKVQSIDDSKPPRVSLTIGGVYHGDTAGPSELSD